LRERWRGEGRGRGEGPREGGGAAGLRGVGHHR